MALIKNRLIKDFTIIPNEIITDTTINEKSKLMFIYLASKPDEWEVNNTDVKNNLGIKSNDTIAKCWKELTDSGWIERTPKIDKNNKFIGGFDYKINTQKTRIPKVSEIGKNTDSNKTKFGKSTILNKTDSNSNTKYNNNTNIVIDLKDEKSIDKIHNPNLQNTHKIINHLYKNIKQVNPSFNKKWDSWIKPILMLLENDKAPYSEVIDVINHIYSEQGQFWIPNILSGKKLREKYDTLVMQMNQNKASSTDYSMISQVLSAKEQGYNI